MYQYKHRGDRIKQDNSQYKRDIKKIFEWKREFSLLQNEL